MAKSMITLQELRKIDPTIQEINNPYKEIPNICEDDDSRTVISVIPVFKNIYCKAMVNVQKAGFAWILGSSFLENYHLKCDLYAESTSKIQLMKSEYKLHNLCNVFTQGPCWFFVCNTNKAEQIIKRIYGIDKYNYKIFVLESLLFVAYWVVLFVLLGGAR